MKAPEGALDPQRCGELDSERTIFLVGPNLKGIAGKKAKDYLFAYRHPHYYFDNYWHAYAYSLRVGNSGAKR